MNKNIVGLAALALLLGGQKAKAQTGGNGGGGGTPTTPGATGAQPPTADPVGGAIGGVVRDVGGAVLTAGGTAVVGWVKGLLATSGTTATTTGGAAGGVVTGGGGAIGGGSTSAGGAVTGGGVAGGGGGGSSGAAATSPATIAEVSISGGVVILGVIALAIIMNVIADSIIRANKGLLNKINALWPNARDLHEFEKFLFDNFREKNAIGGTITTVDVRDVRLDAPVYDESHQITPYIRQGWRTCFRYVPGPPATGSYVPPPAGSVGEISYPWTSWRAPWMGGDRPDVAMLRAFKQFRRVSIEYLQTRTYFFSNLRHRWLNKPQFAYDDGVANHMYDTLYSQANIGGINQVPLLDGQTQWNAEHGFTMTGRPPGNDVYGTPWREVKLPPTEQMRARDATPDEAFMNSPVGVQLIRLARFKALLSAMEVFSADPTFFLIFDPVAYAQQAYERLGLNSDMAILGTSTQAEPWLGNCFITQPSYFGIRAAIDVWHFKDPDNAKGHKMASRGLSGSDKRLNPWWEF